MAEEPAWTEARVLALAPDPASARAGQGLASPRQWANLGQGPNLLWGECQGSGSKPYQTRVAPDDPATSCSCPSRKFPCKHALGLLLIWVDPAAAVPASEPPPWVTTWVESRDKKAEARQQPAEQIARPPANSAAQLKREAARLSKVVAGLDDLDLWLGDLVRAGFATLATRPKNLWDEQARRLIDAQCPGVARRLRQIDAMSLAGEGWQAALLDRLAQLHLLIAGFRRRDALPAEVLADVRAAIGFPADLDGVRLGTAGTQVRDTWRVLGHAFALEDRITVRRTSLWGRDSRRSAVILDFSAQGRPFETILEPGTAVDATLGFLPGAAPHRALLVDRSGPAEAFATLDGGSTIAEAQASFGTVLARSPWVELVPVVLAEIVIVADPEGWSAVDPAGALLPLSRRFDRGWHLEALSGGEPITLVGEFNGSVLNPLGAVRDAQYITLAGPASEAGHDPLGGAPGRWLTPESTLLRDATAAALVGVDRKPPPVAAAGPLGTLLLGVEARPAPARLFAIAAAGGLSARAGRLPRTDVSSRPAPPPTEDRPECSPAATLLLHRLFADHPRTIASAGNHLFFEWLDLCNAAGQRIPFSLLVPTLTTVQNSPDRVRAVLPVLGRRGRWLAARNPVWAQLAGPPAAESAGSIWETGTKAERLALLRHLRANHPAEARRLVEASFGSEPAAFRAAIIGHYADHLADADEAFLEAALDDRSADVRAAAAERLIDLVGSRFATRMAVRARAAFRWEGDGLVITPPDQIDAAMLRDGFTPICRQVISGGAVGEKGWGLYQTLVATPPAVLGESLGQSPEAIIAAIRGSEWEELIIQACEIAALRHRDPAWSRALALARIAIKTTHSSPRFKDLFAAVPRDIRDGLIRGRFESSSETNEVAYELNRFIEGAHGDLGAEVAWLLLREVVAAMVMDERLTAANPTRRAGSIRYLLRQVINQVGDQFPFELLDRTTLLFGTDLAPFREPSGVPPATANFAAMLDRWRFRRDLHQEFSPR